MSKKGFTTQILHSDRLAGVTHGSVHKPVHNSVAYGYKTGEELAAVFQGKEKGYSYGRQNNPTTTALEAQITAMEQGRDTVCFSTGMAAITAAMLTLLKKGDHLISSQFLFGNTNSLFNTLANFGIEVSFVDATDVNNIVAAKQSNTRAVFVETIANPCTQVSDLAAIGDYCDAENLLYVVDNTPTPPVMFNAKAVKASLVTSSLTKLVAGHADVLGGSITDTGLFDWSQYPNILDTYKKAEPATWGLFQVRKKGLRDMGATLSPQSASRIALGAETLALRVPRACENARALASMFAQHSAVKTVHHPSVETHPQHHRAGELFSDYGTLMSIDLKDEDQCFPFINRLRCAVLSSHLGDNRTLVIPVAHTIFYEMGPKRRDSMGISDGTVRISVGIEDQADLLEDFAQALG